jgi:hypothetical protein
MEEGGVRRCRHAPRGLSRPPSVSLLLRKAVGLFDGRRVKRRKAAGYYLK